MQQWTALDRPQSLPCMHTALGRRMSSVTVPHARGACLLLVLMRCCRAKGHPQMQRCPAARLCEPI